MFARSVQNITFSQQNAQLPNDAAISKSSPYAVHVIFCGSKIKFELLLDDIQ
jgi:hypothetical protein